MRHLAGILVVSTALWATPSLSEDYSAGSDGTGETPRAGLAADYTPRGAVAKAPQLDITEADRAAPLTDEAEIIKSLTAVGRSRDGKELRGDVTDVIKEAVKEDLEAGRSTGGAAETFSGEDPAFAESEAARTVFGDDERVQITNTKTPPFRSIGYIETVTAEGNVYRCTGTLIGPRTVMTAAHCLYNHRDGGWYNKYYFVPGMVDNETFPFGAYEHQEVYVVEGYITNFTGTDGGVMSWDLGVIILSEPIGDSLGWMAYQHYANLGSFPANIVGYPADKPNLTLWRTTCDVPPEMVIADNFGYDCDTFGGTSGSAVYTLDKSKKRIAVGVNIIESPELNAALRINATYKQWLNNLNQ